MSIWALPRATTLGGVRYDLNTDYRDVLEIIEKLNDESKPEFLRWRIAVGLFYEQEIPDSVYDEAVLYLADFIRCGTPDEKPGPKLIDWEQDAQLIASSVSKVAGQEIRAVQYMHWWTFVGLFSQIEEGPLSMIVSIRDKKARGKKLEKWEQEYYQQNKRKVDFQKPKSSEDEAIKAYFDKWL